MCDTLGVILEERALFAKNSDRSPNEPQITEFYPACNPSEKTLKATYISIDQASHTYACLLSRPIWMWGAEMGVNEHGVCIGNEAVFTKGKYGKTGLTGMDLLRLGLERGASAAEARDVIIALLEKHGQGGNCGFDHDFYYDNAFLIMDRKELYVLETEGKNWVYKSYPRASISNRLRIGVEGDAYSGGQIIDFKKKNTDPLFTFFSGSGSRWGQTCSVIGDVTNVASMFEALRNHAPNVMNPLCQGSVASTCMHAGGLVGDHTTASMVVELDDEIKVWLTGCSTPCISLFKPWKLGDNSNQLVISPCSSQPDAYWQAREKFHRSLIGKQLPAAFYIERHALEDKWIQESAETKDWGSLTQQALAEETVFYAKWAGMVDGKVSGSKRFHRYWEKKTDNLNHNMGA